MKHSRVWSVSAFCVLAYLALSSALNAADQAKRVLIVHSFGSSAPPFTTHSTAFESTLTQEMGRRVDLDQVSLDMARYAQPDMEEAFVTFLLKRLAKWHPDLVVPIGSPAGRFVAKLRDRLFPETPVIYTGMDRRTLPPGPLQNATFVGENFKLAGLVEDILQLAPETTNIEVILGATPLERYWTTEFRRAFEPFMNRVNFNFLNDLSFDQMLARLSKLPPRSFILLGLLLRDASGVTHNEDEALQRLRAVANAPINGLYQNQLGLGIVGGRLYQGELQGAEAARIAIRVLGGEPISSFPELIVPSQGPQYDWRELNRWNIDESRLPTGSIVRFRPQSAWELYRWYVIAALFIITVQAAIIADLLLQRTRRRRAEAGLRASEENLRQLVETTAVVPWQADAETWTFTYVGPQAVKLLGHPLREWYKQDFWVSHLHPDDKEPSVNARLSNGLKGRDFEIEYRMMAASGESVWVHDVINCEGSNGKSVQLRGFLFDITQRKKAEIELRRLRAELAHVTRVSTMGELAASLAHELNQPLTAILSNAQAAQRYLSKKPADVDEVREILDDIVQDNSRAGEVIRRMRALVKNEDLAFNSLDPASVIQEIVLLVHSDAVLRNVRVSAEFGSALPHVKGDKIQLQQVLLNLLLNAFDAMRDCPLEEREVRIGAEVNGAGMVQISVRDHGTGMTTDKIYRIFQPFFTTKREGLGMGLSISRSIIEAHGGRLWAENNANHKGATFYFTVPADNDASRAWLHID